MSNNILLYGANGYSAKLILEEALKLKLKPILAGRNFSAVTNLSKLYNLDSRIFGLDDHDEIVRNLEDIQVVLNCAGPFSRTIKPLLEACLEKKVHYFDITGEIGVFEIAHSFDEQAKEQGIIICPGVGFDVVPTDCLALMLQEQSNFTATNLELAFHSQGGPSKGTALTSLAGTGTGTKVRRNGEITILPYGSLQKDIAFPHKTLRVSSIPWGDVYTAFISTGIPNITVYMVMHPKTIKAMQRGQRFLFLRNVQPFKWFITRRVKKSIPQGGGPSEEVRKNSQSYIWGQVSNENNSYELFLKTTNGYDLTALTSVQALKRIDSLSNKAGYFTPSKLFGSKFILDIPGTELIKK